MAWRCVTRDLPLLWAQSRRDCPLHSSFFHSLLSSFVSHTFSDGLSFMAATFDLVCVCNFRLKSLLTVTSLSLVRWRAHMAAHCPFTDLLMHNSLNTGKMFSIQWSNLIGSKTHRFYNSSLFVFTKYSISAFENELITGCSNFAG